MVLLTVKYRSPAVPRFILSTCYYRQVIHLLLSNISQIATFFHKKYIPESCFTSGMYFSILCYIKQQHGCEHLHYPYVEHTKGEQFSNAITTPHMGRYLNTTKQTQPGISRRYSHQLPLMSVPSRCQYCLPEPYTAMRSAFFILSSPPFLLIPYTSAHFRRLSQRNNADFKILKNSRKYCNLAHLVNYRPILYSCILSIPLQFVNAAQAFSN